MSIRDIWTPKDNNLSVDVVAGEKGLASNFNAVRADIRYSNPPPVMFGFSDRRLFGTVLNPGATPLSTDDRDIIPLINTAFSTAIQLYNASSGGDMLSLTTSDVFGTACKGLAVIGNYLYACLTTTAGGNETRVYRFPIDDLTTSVQMTITLGTTAICNKMLTDGTNLYFDNDGGDEASANHKFKKYLIDGTTLTYVSDISCGSTSADLTNVAMDMAGNFYAKDAQASAGFKRFANDGTLSKTMGSPFLLYNMSGMMTFEGLPYLVRSDSNYYHTGFLRLPLLP
jgi:hypothetical protein